MYNGKYTNIAEVMEKVSRYGFSNFDIEEAKEWAWEILSKLGIASIYINKQAYLTIENGRSKIPNDCADLTASQMRDYNTGIVLTKSTDTFFPSNQVKSSGSTSIIKAINPGTAVVYDAYGDIVSSEDIASYLVTYQQSNSSISSSSYSINNGYFIFDIDSGIIELSYKAFPIDSNGDPMIPDNAKCIDAVVKYIIERIAYRMWLSDKLADRKYEKIEKDKMWAVASCRSEMSLETIDDWENGFRSIMKLRRDINQQKVGYSSMANRENLNF